jgi:hypothetical protein
MARVLDVIPEAERPVPILSSPHLALQRVRELVFNTPGSALDKPPGAEGPYG